MKSSGLLLCLILFFRGLMAQNPIVPPGVYIADPSAHVWGDGKLYVYGSRDESTDYYCSWSHHVLSSSDLLSWTIHENVFASRGVNDQVPYSDNLLYAPDAWYRNGKYYLYFCLASNTDTEGVAISSSPVGPFAGARPIDLGGYNQIDPGIFVDDDGQAYYLWGQFTAKMAKMKPDMMELDLSTLKDSIVTEKEHFFHEGGYLVKRNGIYYFIYAHMGRAGRPTCIGYATSSSPMGPYTYGGVIVDNDHCDPAVWNNHGSIVEFNGRWYVFYHRSTHASVMMRKSCLEPVNFNEDGSIPEVEMTTQGAAGPLEARNKMDAERACLLYGNVRIVLESQANEILTGIRNDDKAAYKYLDFGKGANRFVVHVAPGKNGGKLDLCLDSSWDRPAGSVDIPDGGDGKTWRTFTVSIPTVEGVHALWLRFYGEGEDLFNVDWFRFE